MVSRICFLVISFILFSCGSSTPKVNQQKQVANDSTKTDIVRMDLASTIPDSILAWVKFGQDVKVKDYFYFMDKLVAQCDTFANWHLTEHILVHANPWILDTLRSFDYYEKMKQGVFVYEQPQLVILHKGDSLAIPDSAYTHRILTKLNATMIDVNIPEFILRLYRDSNLIFSCPVRAGRDAEKFIYVVGHVVNLRTPIGVGEIEWVDRMHKVINLDNGKEYPGTNRDDGKFTKMPMIPWIEPRINGIRYGVMIHPTTNPSTLGKAYSHGCVGTTEADAWTIYYNAPIGTKVVFRYDLQVIKEKGDTIQLEDVYHLRD